MNTPVLSFREDAGDIVVDLPMLLDTRLLYQGSSRSGKTHGLFSLLDDTRGRVQQQVFDREGDFVKLREKHDYLIVGGEGDVPIDLKTKRAVETLVREVLRLKLNVIYDLSDLDEPDRQLFVKRAFAEMADLPRSSGLWTPCLLLLDEAHAFAPEKGQGESEATSAVVSVASRGAKRGFCLVAATQRLASLHKGVSDLCENKVILRTGGESMKRAAKDLGMPLNAETQNQLRSFERGIGYAYGPALALEPLLIRIPSELTVYPPKRGELRAPPPPPANAIKKLIAALPKEVVEAEHEAESLDQAKTQIDQLKKRLKQIEKAGPVRTTNPVATSSTVAVDPKAIERAVKESERRCQERVDAVSRSLRGVESQLRAQIKTLHGKLDVVSKHAGKIVEVSAYERTEIPGVTAQAPARATLPARTNTAEKHSQNIPENIPARVDVEGITEAQARILSAVATLEQIGVPRPSRPSVGALSNYSNTSGGTFASNVSALVAAGLIEIPTPGLLQLTTAGRKAAPRGEAINSLKELHAKWLGVLEPAEARILSALIEAYPDALTRPKLGELTNYTNTSGGTFASNVSKLVEMRAAVIPEKGKVRASDVLFPEGLA